MKSVLGIVVALLLGAAALPAQAGDVTAVKAWARATSPDNRIGIAFVTLGNAGSTADSLIAAETPLAGKVEFHSHVHMDGLMKMRQQASVDLAPGQTVVFSPGGLHLMLLDLKGQLKPGQTFPVTLSFAKAGAIAVTVTVEGAGAMDQSQHMDHSRHDEHMKDPAYKAMHEQHMKDPEHKAMHDRMHGPGK
jgi:copper(I)-binding protein